MTLLHQLMDSSQLLAQLGPAFRWIAHPAIGVLRRHQRR